MSNKIVVIGSANTDLVIYSARMPKLGETLLGSGFQTNAGGKGLNQAVAISKLGGNVSFVGCVGNDSNGGMLLNELKNNGVDFRGAISDGSPTGVAMITVVDGNNFIVLDSGANSKLTPELIWQYTELIAESDYCVMQLEIPLETVTEVCRIAKRSNTKIVLNPAPYVKLPDEIFSCIDYLVPNEHEAEDITGISLCDEVGCKKAVARLRQKGIKNIIITLGERGCVYNVGDEVFFCPARKTSVVDTTSAGDCFIGAVVSALSRNETLENAIRFATKASAITVSRAGASVSIPFAYEIED